jgi:hypothetical protein
MTDTEQCIRQALQEVRVLIGLAFTEAGETPTTYSALDQAGLQNGAWIIEEFLEHGEVSLALDHLIYTIIEPELPILRSTFHFINQAYQTLCIDLKLVEQISACVHS